MSVAPRRPRAHLVAAVLTAGLLAGCSGAAEPEAPAPPPPTSAPSAAPASPGPPATGFEGRPIRPAAEPGDAPEPTEPPAGEVVALPPNSLPWGVAADPASGLVLTALRAPIAVGVLDPRTREVSLAPAPGGARMIDLVEPGGPLLFPSETTDTLARLSVPSMQVESSAPAGRNPHQAVQVGDTTFVTEEFGHAVRALRGGETVARFTEPVQPGGITAVGNRVAAVDVGTGTLFVYDATTMQRVAALPAGEGPSHVVPIGGSRVAVCDVAGRAILTYDLAGTPRELGRADVPGRAFWVEADPAQGTVYAALSDVNRVARLSVAPDGTPTLEATLPTVRQPNSMDLDPTTGMLYVAGYTSAALQMVPVSAFAA